MALSDRAEKANGKVLDDLGRQLRAGTYWGDLTFKIMGGRIYRRIWNHAERVGPDGEIEPEREGKSESR